MFRHEGEISYLVPFDEKHLNSKEYFDWLRDYEVMKTINRLDYIRPVSFPEVREYCEMVMRSKNDIYLAIHLKDGDGFIGTMRIKVDWYLRTADVGIMIGNKTCWNKGVGGDSVKCVGRYLFNVLGMRKLTAGLMEINHGMKKVFENAGFKVEGIFRNADRFEGRYVNHIYMGCFHEEFIENGGKK